MAQGKQLLRLKITAGMMAALITGAAMGALTALAGIVLAGSPLLGAGIALGVVAVIAGMVSAGAIAVHDARTGTETAQGDYIRRAVLSAVTIRTISEPLLFGAKQLTDQLAHREREKGKAFLRRYDLATVCCFGMTHIPNRCMMNIVKLCAMAKVSEEQIKKNAVINGEKLGKMRGFTAGGYI